MTSDRRYAEVLADIHVRAHGLEKSAGQRRMLARRYLPDAALIAMAADEIDRQGEAIRAMGAAIARETQRLAAETEAAGGVSGRAAAMISRADAVLRDYEGLAMSRRRERI
jgi:hypothetical protein